MNPVPCPSCGRPLVPDTACPHCGPTATNGAVPPEVATWVIEKVPPDLLAWARQTFDEAEYLAGVREIEQTGGLQLEDFIGEIEEMVRRRA